MPSTNVSYGMNMYESTPKGTTMFPVGLPNMAITVHAKGAFVLPNLIDPIPSDLHSNDNGPIGHAAIVQGF